VVDQRNVVPIARRPGGNAVAPPVYPECLTSRPGDHSTWSWNSDARRGPVVDQRHVVPIARRPGGNAVAPCLPGVLDVEAWGSLDGELKLGRSTWHVVDHGNAVAPLSARSRDVEASGSLAGAELELGRSTWNVVDQGNVVASLSARSARRRGQGIARRGAEARPLGVSPWSTRGTWFRSLDGLEGTRSLPCLPGVSTSRPLDHSTWS
jgi:hypothetical protein